MTNARERSLTLVSISKKFPSGGEPSTPNVSDVSQNSELGNVNSTDVWTIFPNVSKSGLCSPKRSQCESTLTPLLQVAGF